MAELISMNYGAVAQIEAQIQSAANALGENLENLRGRLAQLNWDGQDAEAYRVHQAEWDQAVVALNELLPEIRAAVIGASENFRGNELRGVSRWQG